ncbi:hypothetical protein K1W69_04135 [Hoeflea sp. WL0058]|uniref:Uncharacterized protein n=1 Tax=Flavimaribacter sediminis TaxID=2865987 RepID=A0AAE3CZ74_9HYPH|nr:hypothetical protein [Flavimaribacter sediminis]MBW8636369.1 hypothetical protein [Flavimaribacter sediminis]
MKHTLIAAALCTGLIAGPAVAQTTGSTSKNAGGPDTMSTQERDMYKANPDFAGFFTDENMGEMKTGEEVAMTYEGLSEDRQEALRRDCEKTFNNRGVYGEATLGLCSQIMEM